MLPRFNIVEIRKNIRDLPLKDRKYASKLQLLEKLNKEYVSLWQKNSNGEFNLSSSDPQRADELRTAIEEIEIVDGVFLCCGLCKEEKEGVTYGMKTPYKLFCPDCAEEHGEC